MRQQHYDMGNALKKGKQLILSDEEEEEEEENKDKNKDGKDSKIDPKLFCK